MGHQGRTKRLNASRNDICEGHVTLPRGNRFQVPLTIPLTPTKRAVDSGNSNYTSMVSIKKVIYLSIPHSTQAAAGSAEPQGRIAGNEVLPWSMMGFELIDGVYNRRPVDRRHDFPILPYYLRRPRLDAARCRQLPLWFIVMRPNNQIWRHRALQPRCVDAVPLHGAYESPSVEFVRCLCSPPLQMFVSTPYRMDPRSVSPKATPSPRPTSAGSKFE
ncbi:hypothetical protein BS47DRAFT_1390736 [Hydnum rufescens UP504]|uniref:Uncharacterized protein n=1 Tax=Hydnum rufescens UP504 TaxID=1448309 RepID=A0A9P6DZ93_9AGAM|nr:hypothetical protein BS47DRAFT_1390736 [Hydnum rufescens UP504]